jgi:hypothetical protein
MGITRVAAPSNAWRFHHDNVTFDMRPAQP